MTGHLATIIIGLLLGYLLPAALLLRQSMRLFRRAARELRKTTRAAEAAF